MSEVTFRSRIRHWREDPPGGLAVIGIPGEHVPALGGRRQYPVSGTIDGSAFSGSTMLVAGGGFCVGVSKASLKAASVDVGDDVAVAITAPSTGG